jgi:uncharacterized glyoxalase superfamily protein PhnB
MPTVMPMIVVEDLEAVSDYYQNVLGFNQGMAMRTPDGSLMMVMVDNGNDAGLMFSAASPESPQPNALNADGLVIYLVTENVDGYHDSIKGNDGLNVVEGLTDQFWGDRTFLIRDPWGLHLQFAQHTGQMSAPPEGVQVDMAQPVG